LNNFFKIILKKESKLNIFGKIGQNPWCCWKANDGKPLMSEISWKQFHNFKTLRWGGRGGDIEF